MSFHIDKQDKMKLIFGLGNNLIISEDQIMKNEKKIYFVAETKSTTDKDKLRKEEQQKILCGENHFKVVEDVNFKHVTKISELIT